MSLETSSWRPSLESLEKFYKKMDGSTDAKRAPFTANVCLENLSGVTLETTQTCYEAFLKAFSNQKEEDRNRFAKKALGTLEIADFPFHWCQLGLYTNYEEILDIALRRDEWDKISKILQKISPESFENWRGKVVIRAALFGHLDLIKECLENGTITIEDFGAAIRKGCGLVDADKSLAITQFLFQKVAAEGKQISEESRGGAVTAAVLRGNTPLLDLLLEEGSITESHRGIALTIAARSDKLNGRADIVQKLLQNGPISEDSYKKAVEVTISLGYFDVFELLYKHKPLICTVITEVYFKNCHDLYERELGILSQESEISKKILTALMKCIENQTVKDQIIQIKYNKLLQIIKRNQFCLFL